MTAPAPSTDVRIIGRYALHEEIAAGGMATVHLGRLLGPAGFSRTVAIKRLHAQYARDPEFTSMFLDEARLAARIRHPNVVSTLDVVALDGELFIVMDYVEGESVARLVRTARQKGERIPVPIAIAVMAGVLYGVHAAHEAKGEHGEPLGLVHRDVSPQNILVDTDGVPRVVDFGVAKAVGRLQTTRDGQLKGKLAYMAPEQLRGHKVDARTDIFAASVVLWELLSGKRLFQGENEAATFGKILECQVPAPSSEAEGIPPEIDEIVMKGLAPRADDRWEHALDMAETLERASRERPTQRDIGRWVRALAIDSLAQRAAKVRELESHSAVNELVGAPRPAPDIATASAPLATVGQPVPPTVQAPPSFEPAPSEAVETPLASTDPIPDRFGVAKTLVAEAPPAEPPKPPPADDDEPTLHSDSKSLPRPAELSSPQLPTMQSAEMPSSPEHALPFAPVEPRPEEQSASSQISSIALERQKTAAPPARSNKALIPIALGTAGVLVSLLVVGVVLLVRSGSSESSPEPAVVPIVEPAAAGKGAAVETKPTEVKPLVPPEPPASSIPSAKPVPTPVASATKKPAPAPTKPVTPTTIKKPTTAARKPNCNPPYTVDKDGTRIPKLECL